MIIKRKLFARGVVSTMNPIFKNKSGMAAANKTMKNARVSGLSHYKPNTNIKADVTPANLPKRGLNHPNYMSSSEASLQNNLYTRRGDIKPLQRFKDVDAVSQLRTGRKNLSSSSGSPISSLAMSPGNQKLNNNALNGAINTRTPGSLMANREQVVSGVRNMKSTLISNKSSEMNALKRLMGGEKKLQGQSLNQLFRS